MAALGAATTSLEVDRISVPVEVLSQTINPRAQGELPVPVLSTSSFGAQEMDVASVLLGDGGGNAAPVARQPNGRLFASIENVDGDGHPDLVLHFQHRALSALGVLAAPVTRLWLLAKLTDGCRQVAGSTDVRVLNTDR